MVWFLTKASFVCFILECFDTVGWVTWDQPNMEWIWQRGHLNKTICMCLNKLIIFWEFGKWGKVSEKE